MNCVVILVIVFCFVSNLYAVDVDSNVTTIDKVTTCKISEYVLALQDDCKFGYDTIHGLW